MQEHHSGPSNRRFGIEVAIALTALSLYRADVRILFLSLALFTMAIIRPAWLWPLNIAWTTLGRFLARCLQPIASAVIFFAVFTPAGLLARLLRRDALRLRRQPQASTCWIAREPQAIDWTRQF